MTVLKDLNEKGYSHSVRNRWEYYKSGGNNLAVLELNYTRYLKNGEVMGSKERTTSYILRKNDDGHRIVGIVPHTPRAR